MLEARLVGQGRAVKQAVQFEGSVSEVRAEGTGNGRVQGEWSEGERESVVHKEG
jgi:hypothetical protein